MAEIGGLELVEVAELEQKLVDELELGLSWSLCLILII